jgi:hypothetical protein
MELREFVAIYKVDNLRHSKCINPNHDEYGHLCEELVELKAATNMTSFAEELADVIIVAIIYANKVGVDLVAALESKTIKNYRNKRLVTLDNSKFTITKLTKFI